MAPEQAIYPIPPPPHYDNPHNNIPSVYPPTGPYLPDYNPPSANPYSHQPHYQEGVQQHHHTHEHTHHHKGFDNGVLLGTFREDKEHEGLENIEHLGRQFRGQVQTIPSQLSPGIETFVIKNNPRSQKTDTFRIKSNKPRKNKITNNNPNSQSSERFRIPKRNSNFRVNSSKQISRTIKIII